MKIILAISAALVLVVPAVAQERCYVDPSGNVRCLGGPTIYNQGNGAYRDLSGNRWQFETTPPPAQFGAPRAPTIYDRMMDNQARQCRDFPSTCSR